MVQPHTGEHDAFAHDVAARIPLPPHVTPDAAAGAAMCTLTERLTAGQAHAVLDALPSGVRPLFERCVRHRDGVPVLRVDRAAFLERVASHLGATPAYAAAICRAVFEAMHARLPPDVVAHVGAQLPHDLQELWFGTTRVSPKAMDAVDARSDVVASIVRDAAMPWDEADEAFSAVMCTLADRLSGGQAEHVYLGLPETLRPLVARCILHRHERAEPFDDAELLRRVGDHLGVDPERAEIVTRAVFAAVKRVLPDQEIEAVASQLPEPLRKMWGE